MRRDVPGFGPLDAKLVIVGEAPGREEVREKKPFVGAAGKKLRQALLEVDINPQDVRFENVVEYKLPDNDEGILYTDSLKRNPTGELLKWWDDLETRLSNLKNRQAIVLCGETPLKALTAESSVGRAQCYVIPTKVGTCIPVYHPAYFLPHRSPHERHWLTLGLRKAKEVIAGRHDSPHEFILKPSLDEAIAFLDRCSANALLSIDIETNPATNDITCLGIALDERRAISIPFKVGTSSYWTPSEEALVLAKLAKLFSDSQTAKLFQNFIFDTMHLARAGLPIHGIVYDTMYNAHVLNPELPKSLRDLARMYCYCAPWKDTKDWTATTDLRDLWRYNARDCVRTFEIFNRQEEELVARNLHGFRDNHIQPLLQCILTTCRRGIRVDRERLAEISSSLSNALRPVRDELVSSARPYISKGQKKKKLRDPEHDTPTDREYTTEEWKKLPGSVRAAYARDRKTGKVSIKAFKEVIEEYDRDFNPGSAIQKIQVLTTMGFKVPKKRRAGGTFSESSDLTSIQKLLVKNRNDKFLSNLYRHSKLSKLASNYSEDALRLDPDGRFRFSYGIGSKSKGKDEDGSAAHTGRLKGGPTPWGTGRNVQNFPREKEFNFKRVFVADKGMVMLNTDLDRAEAYLVAWFSQDEKLIQIFDEGIDFHQYVADEFTKILGKKIDRQTAKPINYGTMYGMRGKTLSEQLLLDHGIDLPVSTCEKLIEARDVIFPGIPAWRKGIRERLTSPDSRNWYLENPFGRIRYFYGPRQRDSYDRSKWSGTTEKIFRDAYAQLPQSTAHDVVVKAWAAISERAPWIEVLMECHDSLLMQCPEPLQEKAQKIIDECFRVEIPIHGKTRIIPHGTDKGYSWGEL